MQPVQSTFDLLASRAAAIEEEIAKIMADAERRAAPLRKQALRNSIAVEVLRELTATPVKEVSLDAYVRAEVTLAATLAPGKWSVKSLILDELVGASLPLSKAELIDRFVAAGRNVHENTVGSTLSRLVSEGMLVKADGNRYQTKPAEATATEQNTGGVAAT